MGNRDYMARAKANREMFKRNFKTAAEVRKEEKEQEERIARRRETAAEAYRNRMVQSSPVFTPAQTNTAPVKYEKTASSAERYAAERGNRWSSDVYNNKGMMPKTATSKDVGVTSSPSRQRIAKDAEDTEMLDRIIEAKENKDTSVENAYLVDKYKKSKGYTANNPRAKEYEAEYKKNEAEIKRLNSEINGNGHRKLSQDIANGSIDEKSKKGAKLDSLVARNKELEKELNADWGEEQLNKDIEARRKDYNIKKKQEFWEQWGAEYYNLPKEDREAFEDVARGEGHSTFDKIKNAFSGNDTKATKQRLEGKYDAEQMSAFSQFAKDKVTYEENEANEKAYNDAMKKIAQMSDEDKAELGSLGGKAGDSAFERVRQDRLKHLADKYGYSTEETEILAILQEREQNKIDNEEYEKLLKPFLEKHPWLAWAATSANILGGTFYLMGQVGDTADAIRLKELGYEGKIQSQAENNPLSAAYNLNTINQEVNGDRMGGWYDRTNQIASNILMNLSGAVPSALMFFSSGYASGVNEATANGTDFEHAQLTGASQGINEMLFEKLSWGSLEAVESFTGGALKSSGIARSLMEWLPKIALDMGINGLEEVNTDIANDIADYLINGDFSKYALEARSLLEEGYSQDEVNSIIGKEIAKSYAETFKEGALQGAIMAGAYKALGEVKARNIGKQAQKYGYTRDIIENAEAAGESAKQYKDEVIAQEGGDKNLSPAQIGRIVQETQKTLAESETARENLKKYQEQYKETRNEALDRALERVKSSGITDEGVRNSFHDSYSGGDMETYARNFANAAQLASTGLSEREYINKLESLEMLDGMGAHAIQAAYASGLNSTISKSGAHMFATMNAVRSKEKRRAISSMVSLVDEFGKQRGLSFTFVDTINDKNGFYRNKTGSNQIVISLDAEGTEATDIKGIKPERNIPAILRTVAHETFHWLEQYDKDNDATLSSELKDFIVGYYENVKGKEWLNDTLEKNYPSSTYKTEEARISEFVADNLFSAFASDRAVNELVSKNENLAKRVKRHIGEAITFFRNAIKKMEAKGIYQEISEMQKNLEMLDEINNRFFDALNKATGREARNEQKSLDTILENKQRVQEATKLAELLKGKQVQMEEEERQKAAEKKQRIADFFEKVGENSERVNVADILLGKESDRDRFEGYLKKIKALKSPIFESYWNRVGDSWDSDINVNYDNVGSTISGDNFDHLAAAYASRWYQEGVGEVIDTLLRIENDFPKGKMSRSLAVKDIVEAKSAMMNCFALAKEAIKAYSESGANNVGVERHFEGLKTKMRKADVYNSIVQDFETVADRFEKENAEKEKQEKAKKSSEEKFTPPKVDEWGNTFTPTQRDFAARMSYLNLTDKTTSNFFYASSEKTRQKVRGKFAEVFKAHPKFDLAGKSFSEKTVGELFGRVNNSYDLYQIYNAYRKYYQSLSSDEAVSREKQDERIKNIENLYSEAYKRIKGNPVGRNLNLSVGTIELNDLQKLFKELNSDSVNAKLATKVFKTAKALGVKTRFVSAIKGASGEALAGKTIYSLKEFNAEHVTDQRKADIILHELIHNCTVYALHQYQYNKNSLAPELVPACKTIWDAYLESKEDSHMGKNNPRAFEWVDTSGKKRYGLKNEYEFVAELANADFRAALKARNLLQKVIDSIKQLFGVDTKNRLDEVSAAVEYIITNPDTDAFENFHSSIDWYSYGSNYAFSTQRNRLADNGIEITDDNTARFSSIRAFAKFDENGEFVIDKAKVMECAEDMSTATGIPYKKCLKYLKDNLSLTALVLQDREHLEYEADDFYSAFKSNSEYWWGAIDFNTNCPKRKSFTEIYDRLQQKWNKRSFDQWDLAIIRNVLQDSGIQVACGLCFVEDRRQQLGKIATDYISMVKASQKTGETLTKKNSSGKLTPLHVTEKLAEQWGDILGVKKGDDLVITDDYVPTQYDLGTYEGFRALRENHPQIAMGYIAYNNSRGQQSGRLIEGTAEYKRQILDLTQKQVDTINNNGGLRIFSFSDFETPHTIDLIQIIEDCSARGIKIQAYTKQPAFARMVKDTNLKLNLSRIPSGIGYREVARGFKNAVEHNGKYYELTFDNVEGINKDVDNYIDTNKNDNIGNVLVGINETQIRLAMKSKMIDFIIPFHTNQRRAVLAVKGVSKKWVNYKNTQNEKVKSTGKNAKTNVNIYTDVIQKHGISNEAARAKGMTAERMFTEAFLQECAEKGLTPRFAEFLDKGDIGGYGYTEGYYKFLVDYKLFNQNGEMLEQKVVVPKFDLGYVREMIEAQRDSSSAFEVEKPKRDAAVNEIDALIRSGAMNEGGALRKQVQEAAKNRKVDEIPSVRDMVSSTKREAEYAPTFYSQMGKVIAGVKQDKLSVNGLINMLKGKGVKDEEIQWSGIEEWLADKGKSVTKKELQEFIQNSMLKIEQVTLGDKDADVHVEQVSDSQFYVDSPLGERLYFFYDEESDMYFSPDTALEFENIEEAESYFNDPYLGEDGARRNTNWHDYKVEGGTNYREILFTMPGSEYRNRAMATHWGRKGVLAHARIQDMSDVRGKKMLFIEEIQSDWHNAAEKKENGVTVGYIQKGERNRDTIARERNDLVQELIDKAAKSLFNKISEKAPEQETLYALRLMDSDYQDVTILSLKNRGIEVSEGELETIRSYADRYGKLTDEWVDAPRARSRVPDAPFKNGKYVDYVLKNLLRMAAENGYDKLAWTPAEMQSKRWSDEFAEGYRIEYDQDIPKFLNKFGKKFGTKVGESYIMSEDEPVWSIDITPEMRDSVLYEGQPIYSTKRDAGYLDAIEEHGADSKQVKDMVEQAAKEWGAYSNKGVPVTGYHATPYSFNAFDIEKTSKTNDLGQGIYITNDVNDAENNYAKSSGGDVQNKIESRALEIFEEMGFSEEDSYSNDYVKEYNEAYDRAEKEFNSGKVMPLFFKITNPLYVKGRNLVDENGDFVVETQYADYKMLLRQGYDGIVDNTVSGKFSNIKSTDTVHYVVFDNRNVKSADPVTYDDQGNIIPLSERFNSENEDIRYSSRRDSDGNQLTTEQESFFEKSKIRDENGNLLVVYHGTDEDFTVFDKTKGRSTMDIQGMFFSPWEIDAGGYGQNVGKYYLNITNPAPESTAYKALNMYKGQNNAGVKAREYLEKLGYDGVNNGNEEYIAFNSNQIKRVDNLNPTENEDTRYSEKRIKEIVNDAINNKGKIGGKHNTQRITKVPAAVARIESNKKNRVTAVQFSSKKELRTLPHSPRFDYNIPSSDESVNPESSSSRRDIQYETEKALENATEAEMKQIVDAVDRELLGDAMGYGRMLGEQKRKTEQKVKEQRRKDVEYYHRRMKEIRADRDQKLMALKMLQYQKEVERKEFSKRQDYKGRIIRKYEKLQKMLLHPTENQHVPADLVHSIADFLEYITPNFLQEQYRKDGTTIKKREKNNNRLMDLVYAYGKIKEEYEDVYDEEVYNLLQEASKSFGNKSIDEMDSYELSDINNLLGAIEHTIRRANKAIVEGKERDAYALARNLVRQSDEGKKKQSNFFKRILWAQLNPYSVFHAMSNYEDGGWMDMYKILNEGQLRKTQIQVDVVEAFKDLMNNKELDKLSDYKNGLVDVGLIGDNNQPVKITRDFMLALYLHLQNEQNRNHIAEGGLTIPDFEKYYKGDMEAWGNEIVRTLAINGDLFRLHMEQNRLRELKRASNSKEIKARYDDDIAELENQMNELRADANRFMDDIMVRIESQLTDYERKFIDKARWFFNEYSKDKLNEATMQMYGFKKAREDNYMPIITDSDFLNAQFESVVRDASLENMGFMKERVKGANNAIKLFGLTDVINAQLNKVSKYAGLAPAIKEFNNVYNKKFFTDGRKTSVQEASKRRFGVYGQNYIEYLLADLQGGRKAKGSTKIFSQLRGNSYQAALLLNARVALAQTGSYPTAAAEVGWKPLRKALLKGGKDGKVISKADRELIDIYTPLLANRFTGGSSTDITNVKNTNLHTLSGINNRILQRTRAVSDWISMMDTMTVGRLWSAAEYYVDEHYNLEKGTEEEIKNGQSEYYKKVAEVFNRIVERTQPSYTTMQRPELLRNPNEMLRMFTMFMTQRSQNFNLVYDSVGKFLNEAEKKKSGVYDVTEYSEAKSAMGRAVASQAIAGVTLATMKALVDAIQHNFKDFKDDDDDITILSVLERIFKTFLESEVSNMIGGSELFSFIESAVTGSTYYGITANVAGSIEDMSTAISNLFKSGVNAKTLTRVATTSGMIIGLPASQLKKWIEMFVAWGTDIANGEFDSE